MRINKIDPDETLDIEEFITKYGDELDEDNVSQEVIDNAIPAIKEEYNWKRHKYITLIRRIYISILEIEKLDYPNGSVGSFYNLIRYMCCLNNDFEFKYLRNDKKDLCLEAYNKLYSDEIYAKYMKEKMPEQFKEKHILDIRYHMNCFKRFKISKDLRNELNNYNWFFI